jgi:hypothetical protein
MDKARLGKLRNSPTIEVDEETESRLENRQLGYCTSVVEHT